MGALGFLQSQAKSAKESKQKHFELEYDDEVLIQKLTHDIVEDVAYTLHIEEAEQGKFGRENPYYTKEGREFLRYQLNIALRKLGREKKIHFGKGTEKIKHQHPLVAYLKTYLFEAVRDEMTAPSE